MRIKSLHRWRIGVGGAVEIQRKLGRRVSLRTSFSWSDLKWIGGADVSYTKGDDTLYAAVVVLSFPGFELVEERWVKGKATFPYIPGFLSFREAPTVLRAFSLLRQKPQVMVFDGQGIAHPRGFGLAAHLGLILDLPAVGCAKTKLVGEHGRLARSRGSWVWLKLNGRRVGTVVRTREDFKPVFVSPGHRVSLAAATRVVLAATRRYRLPEPVRLAHQAVNRVRREGR